MYIRVANDFHRSMPNNLLAKQIQRLLVGTNHIAILSNDEAPKHLLVSDYDKMLGAAA